MNIGIPFAGIDSPGSDIGLFALGWIEILLPFLSAWTILLLKTNSNYKSDFIHAKHAPASDPSCDGIPESRG